MKVFISWSGDRSKHIAETLQKWLRRVLQATEPWISTHIDKGVVWDNEISRSLNESQIGILCLTSDNLESPYLHYEAGAISNVSGAIVCTFLFDIDSINVKQPLSRFQNTKNDDFDILALLRTINSKLKENGETHLIDNDLEENFKLFYPLLKTELEKTPATNRPKPKRKDADLLEEILKTVRAQSKSGLLNLEKDETQVITRITDEMLLATLRNTLKENYWGDYQTLKNSSADHIITALRSSFKILFLKRGTAVSESILTERIANLYHVINDHKTFDDAEFALMLG